VQLHLQVNPETFAAHWNASQAIAGVQLALGANSPFFFGKELWRETRIALFEQATDTRSDELKAQGVRPRVWFGERWITSIFDLFEENVRYFPSLLPIVDDEDPLEVLERGDVPQLGELRLHNGTDLPLEPPGVRRGARPAAPAGRRTAACRPAPTSSTCWPTPRSTTGLVKVLAEADRPVWSQMSFTAAEENFHNGARHGIDARSTGRASARCRPPSWCCGTCCRCATAAWRVGGPGPLTPTGCCGIIEQRCLKGSQRRLLAGPTCSTVCSRTTTGRTRCAR
jgi:hypothetical protein